MNRIGLHIIGGTGLALAGAGRPRIVKLCDCSPEYKAQVRAQVGPECLIVVRWVEAAQPLSAPEAEAEEWFRRHEGQMRQMAAGDGQVIFEGYNEVPDSLAERFGRFEAHRLGLLHWAGLRAGVGSWSVGTPDVGVWETYRPALAAMDSRDVLCLHEYWADGGDLGNPWLVGRFANPSIAVYLRGKAIAVTECGRDQVGGRGAPGWQRTCSAETYLDELRQYDALLARYPQAIGATVFTVGGQGWEAFNVEPIWPEVVAEYGAQEAESPPAPGEGSVTLDYDGRGFSPSQYREYVQETEIAITHVIVHHTYVPRLEDWLGQRTMEAMRRTYEAKGWRCGPHAFCGPDGIWVMTPLGHENRGHLGEADTDPRKINVEIVGDYSNALPVGEVLENALACVAALVEKSGKGTGIVSKHNDWAQTACPGAHLSAHFPWFIGLVRETLRPVMLEEAIGQAVQESIIPLNPQAAFEVAGARLGRLPASREVDVMVDGVTYRAQAYRSPGAREWQYVVYCRMGDWANLRWFERKN